MKRPAGATALLLVDLVNHFEFPGGDRLLAQARPIAPRIARLKARARAAGHPVVYVNDNFGQWRSNPGELLRYCLRDGAPGRTFVEAIQPDREDYLVLKPMHSAFHQTPLLRLLETLGVGTLVLAGLATDSCITTTAHDANMRDFRLIIVSDGCAARTATRHRQALALLRGIDDAKVMRASAVPLPKRRPRSPRVS